MMNLGLLDHLIDVYAYRYPQMVYLTWDDLNHAASENRKPPVTLTNSGLTLYLAERTYPQWLEIGVQPANGHEIAYLLEGEILARQTLLPTYDTTAFVTRVLEVPAAVRAQGVTMLRVLPTTANGERAVAHLWMLTP